MDPFRTSRIAMKMKGLVLLTLLHIAKCQHRNLRTPPMNIADEIKLPLSANRSIFLQEQSESIRGPTDVLVEEIISQQGKRLLENTPVSEILVTQRSYASENNSWGKGKGGMGKKNGGVTSPKLCTGQTDPFDSLILVRFDGNPDDVSTADVQLLEDAFRRTYNELVSALCDDEDRTVTSASAVTHNGSVVIRNGGLSYSIKFAVQLTCRGCDGESARAFSAPSSGYSTERAGRFLDVTFSSDESLLPAEELEKSKRFLESSKSETGLEDAKNKIRRTEYLSSVTMNTYSTFDEKMFVKDKCLHGYHLSGNKVACRKGSLKGDKGEKDNKSKSKGNIEKDYGYKIGKGKENGAEEVDKGSGKGKGLPAIGPQGKGGSSKKGAVVSWKKGNGSGKKGRGSSGLCNCESSDPQFRPPTEREFQVAFNRNIQSSASERGIQTRNMLAVDVVELEGVACANSVSEFKTHVAVEFDASAPPSLNDQEVLEQSFAEVYNGLSDIQCDPLFRRVRVATISIDSLMEKGLQRYVVRYVVSGTCRGCALDTNLFLSESDKAKSQSENDRQAQNQSPPKCACPVFNPPKRPPTKRGFTSRYEVAVRELRAQGDLQQVKNVRKVTELEEVRCPGLADEFASVVVTDHKVVDTPVQSSELLDLAKAFTIAYNRANALNFNACDPLFRTIRDVRVLMNGPSNFNRPLPDGKVRLTYLVDAECRGCDASTDLFAVAKSTSDRARNVRELQMSEEKCFCPSNYSVKREPTTLEFQKRFDAVIDEFSRADILTTIQDPQNVIEVDERECSSAEKTFESKVFVDLMADTSRVTSNDLATVELIFRDTYNNLIETLCDPLFRNILNASVKKGDLRVSSDATRIRYTFFVDARCRGCEQGTTIFSLNAGASDTISRRLAENDLCFCATGNPEIRALTVIEFEKVFDKRIRKLKKSGQLKGIYSVIDVAEEIKQTNPPIPNPPVSPVSPVFSTKAPEPPTDPVSPVSPVFITKSPETPAPVPPVSPVFTTISPEPTIAPVSPLSPAFPTKAPESPMASESPISPALTPTLISPTESPTKESDGGSALPSWIPSTLPSNSPSFSLDVTDAPITMSPPFETASTSSSIPSQTPSSIPSDAPSNAQISNRRKLSSQRWTSPESSWRQLLSRILAMA